MFGLPGQIDSINEGPEIVNITLTGLDDVMKGEQTVIKGLQSMKIEKSNLPKLAEMGVGSDQITEPWYVILAAFSDLLAEADYTQVALGTDRRSASGHRWLGNKQSRPGI